MNKLSVNYTSYYKYYFNSNLYAATINFMLVKLIKVTNWIQLTCFENEM